MAGIAAWTYDQFGPRQADIYAAEVIARCEGIARGEVVSRSCAVLIAGADDLRYARVGEHFVVFLDQADVVIVVDFLHGRSDLPRHIAALTVLRD